MGQDWAHLGGQVRRARATRWRTRAAFARASGVSERTLARLEQGEPGARSPEVLAAVEATLGWAPGSMGVVARGGSPTPEVDERLTRLLAAWPDLDETTQRTLMLVAEEQARGGD